MWGREGMPVPVAQAASLRAKGDPLNGLTSATRATRNPDGELDAPRRQAVRKEDPACA